MSTFLSKTMFERFCSDVDLLNDYIIKMSNEKLTISTRIKMYVRLDIDMNCVNYVAEK